MLIPLTQVPSSAEGKSLVPLLMNKSATVRTSASSQFAHCCGKGVAVNASSVCDVCGSAPSSTISYMGYTVRTAEWRWIEWHRWNGTVLRPECAIMATELYVSLSLSLCVCVVCAREI